MAKKALITGITGQDGAYLSHFLAQKGYEVHGIVRRSSHLGVADHRLRWLGVAEQVTLHDANLVDLSSLLRVVAEVQPDEVYNLAGFTSVGASWGAAETVAEANGMAVLRMLESLRAFRDRHGWAPRFFQPSATAAFSASE